MDKKVLKKIKLRHEYAYHYVARQRIYAVTEDAVGLALCLLLMSKDVNQISNVCQHHRKQKFQTELVAVYGFLLYITYTHSMCMYIV